MSLFIVGAEKLVVIDFVHEVGSPLSESRIAILTSPSYCWTKFQIVGSPFSTVIAIVNYFT